MATARKTKKKAKKSGRARAALDSESLTRAAECLKTLAHPTRIAIVRLLLSGRYTVGELAESTGVASNLASEHLRLMERCGFLTRERNGKQVYYAVAEPHLVSIVECIEDRFGRKK